MRALLLAVAASMGGCDETAPLDAGADAGTVFDAGDDGGDPRDAGDDASVRCTSTCGDCEECVAGACVVVGEPGEVARLRSGWYHLLAIDTAGVLHVWGENDNGQLGLGDRDDRFVAAALPGAWIAADGGSRHSCAVRADGTLLCMGANVHGQLGNGDLDDRLTPTEVIADPDRDRDNPWVDVACGGLHTCGLKQDGTVWCFGSTVAGQCGLGPPTEDVLIPTRVGGSSPPLWAEVAAQTRHTCAIVAADRSLHCWGDNSNGQIGQGDPDREDRNTPQPILGLEGRRFARVRTGALHTCAIDEAGALLCFGQNSFGQLGIGDTVDRGEPTHVGDSVAGVATGFEHSCAVSTSGELSCWGSGALYQLGLGDPEARLTPVRVGTATDWASVVAGYYHSCGLRTDGTAYCWGDHARGQLGAGRDLEVARATPGSVCFATP